MSNTNEATFWIVWNPRGPVPTYKHPTFDHAVVEAERLARKCPGETFIVFESVCARRVDDMLRIDMRLPF